MLKASGIVFSILFLSTVAAPESHPSSADRAAIAHAQKMYYSLLREGVRTLQCKAHPDWPQILASMIATGPDAKARALPYLSKVEFEVTVTASTVNVTAERIDDQPPQELASNLGKLIELVRFNIQQSFDVWRIFAFKLPLPNSSENYRLEHRDGRYKIAATAIPGLQIELDENWIIQEVRTAVPGDRVTLSIRPHYVRNPNGLQLTALEAANVAEPLQLIQMTIDYVEKDGLQLPAKFSSESQHPGGIVSDSVKFDHYAIGRL